MTRQKSLTLIANFTRSKGELEYNSQNDSSRGLQALKQIVRQTPSIELE